MNHSKFPTIVKTGLLSLAVFSANSTIAGITIGAQIGGPARGHPPRGSIELNVGKSKYHYHDGRYYKRGPNGYVVARAPVGAVLHTLPRGYVTVSINGLIYYRYNNVYYRYGSGGYVVVTPPPAIVIEGPAVKESTPEVRTQDNEVSVWLSGSEYLLMNGAFFKVTPEGLVWTEPPYSAVSKHDISLIGTRVWHNEIEYFNVQGVIFRKSIHGYKVVPEPWKEEAP